MRNRIITVIITAMLMLCLLPMDIFAATGTVTSTNVNARAEPSTSSAVIGIASYGETYEIAGSSTDSAGATWYAVTLSSGARAYIRSDFITVTDDTQEQAKAPQEVPEFQIVMADDGTGQSTYYLYFNKKGTRIKLSDIEAYQNQLRQLKKEVEENTKKGKTRVTIVLILFILAIASIVAMFLKMTNMAQEAQRARPRRSRPEPEEERRDPNLTRSGQKPAPTRRRPAVPSPAPKTIKVATPSDEETQPGNISFFDTTSFGQTGKLSQTGRLNQTGRLSETGPIKQDTGSMKAAGKKPEAAKPVPSYLEDFFDE